MTCGETCRLIDLRWGHVVFERRRPPYLGFLPSRAVHAKFGPNELLGVAFDDGVVEVWRHHEIGVDVFDHWKPRDSVRFVGWRAGGQLIGASRHYLLGGDVQVRMPVDRIFDLSICPERDVAAWTDGANVGVYEFMTGRHLTASVRGIRKVRWSKGGLLALGNGHLYELADDLSALRADGDGTAADFEVCGEDVFVVSGSVATFPSVIHPAHFALPN